MISAVGQLNRPQLPNIEGRESFAGPSFHSARWDHTVDLAGKRVAVVGTGCSAAQFVPIIAEQVDRPRGLPAHAELAVPGAALPPRGAGRDAVAAPPRAVLPAVVPVLAVLAGRRAAAPDGRGRPRVAGAGALGQRAQRHAAGDAHRGARGPVHRAARPAAQGHPAVPAGRQADHRRQRLMGRRAAPRQRDPDDRPDRADRARGHRHRRRHAPRVRRDHLRHRLPAVAVPHPDEGRRPRRSRPARAAGTARPAPTSA